MHFDWADYFADTRHLSTVQHGAYLLLIAHYWQHKGLPADERALAQIAGLSADEWARSRAALYGLFKLGNWKHKRIEAELTESARLSIAGRTGGKASGAARAKKRAAGPAPRTIEAKSFNDPATQRVALREKKDSEVADATSAADAAKPVYTDSKHELWGEGVPILVQLGLSERSARENIGRWLRDTKDDAGVLGAIQRARPSRHRSGALDHARAGSTRKEPGRKTCCASSQSHRRRPPRGRIRPRAFRADARSRSTWTRRSWRWRPRR
jgi:uncharacterized protein YdaU (DUF1376 family)